MQPIILKHEKILSLSTLFLFLLAPSLLAQSGIAKSLEVGNRWVYYHFSISSTGYYQEVITQDTTISRRRYAVVTRGPGYSRLERADSSRIYQYAGRDSSENRLCDFKAKIGDSIGGATVRDTFVREVWGSTRRYVVFSYSSQFSVGGFTYAEGIGEVSSWNDSHGHPQVNTRLVGAVLNGVVYGDTSITAVNEQRASEVLPVDFYLYQNHPNPFNPFTTIEYALSRQRFVSLKVYDLLGREKGTLLYEIKPPGTHHFRFDASALPSGIYFYRLQVGEQSVTRKMVLLKP